MATVAVEITLSEKHSDWGAVKKFRRELDVAMFAAISQLATDTGASVRQVAFIDRKAR